MIFCWALCLFFVCRSFFQSVCVLGYCLLPPSVALVFCRLVLLFEQNTLLFVFRFLFTMIGFAYAVYGQFQISAVWDFKWLRWFLFIFFSSCFEVPRRQPTAKQKSSRSVPNLLVLLHHFVARHFPHAGLIPKRRDARTSSILWSHDWLVWFWFRCDLRVLFILKVIEYVEPFSVRCDLTDVDFSWIIFLCCTECIDSINTWFNG